MYNGSKARLIPEKADISAALPYFINRELRREVVMRKNSEYIGKRFGRWIVLDFANDWDNSKFLCRCDCGTEKIVRIYGLLYGRSKSCGCYSREVHRESMKEVNKYHNPSYKHGGWKTRLFKTWDGMKYRCYYPNSKNYKRYGKRGISICDEWKNDFKAFRDWALTNGYRDDLIIDRIDNDGNYEPGNCRWVTHKESSRNTSTTCNYFYDGEYHTASELAEKYNINLATLKSRLHNKWSLEETLSVPTGGKRSNKFIWQGKAYSLRELSEIYAISYATLQYRLYVRKWGLKETLLTPIDKRKSRKLK